MVMVPPESTSNLTSPLSAGTKTPLLAMPANVFFSLMIRTLPETPQLQLPQALGALGPVRVASMEVVRVMMSPGLRMSGRSPFHAIVTFAVAFGSLFSCMMVYERSDIIPAIRDCGPSAGGAAWPSFFLGGPNVPGTG